MQLIMMYLIVCSEQQRAIRFAFFFFSNPRIRCQVLFIYGDIKSRWSQDVLFSSSAA